MVALDLPTAHAATLFAKKVNFGTSGTPVPAGYVNDIGTMYSAGAGSGWIDATTGNPRQITADTRYKPGTNPSDPRLESYALMQKTTPAGWQQAVPAGTYDVTVATGDSQYYDSVHRVVVEGVVAIDGFVPSAANKFRIATVRVSVTDGLLTVLPTGGTNTKLNFVDIQQVDVDGPTVGISLAGPVTGEATYSGPVTATVTTTDDYASVITTTVSIDGGAATPYTAPVVVAANGTHTLVATALDEAGNSSSSTSTFTIDGDVTPPNVTIQLSGSLISGTTYGSDVTTTVTATDPAPGTGVASYSISIDGGAAAPYTEPVVVSGSGSHTVTATATDGNGNVGTATSTFTIGSYVSKKVNFGTSGTPVPAGYVNDIGTSYSVGVGSGWIDATTGNPRQITADTRYKPGTVAGDVRYESYALMQKTTPAGWQAALPTGVYDVTVAVGDSQYYDSVHRVVAEGEVVIDSFVPSAANKFRTATVRVSVTDGFLTVLPTGGTNTKIDFIEIQQVQDTGAPTVSVTPFGSLGSGSLYSGPVTLTVASADNVGVASTTLAIDGAPAAPYTAPVTVSTDGAHTAVATATDTAGNITTATTDFSIDATAPTVAISLAGTLNGVEYEAPVNVTITAADSGSGLASTTYTLDGGDSTPYTDPFPVETSGSHTVVASTVDAAGNTATTTSTFSVTTGVDTTPPSVSVALAGSTVSPGVYWTDVTATATASDLGGSGLASITYTVDGGESTPYTDPVVISGAGSHTIVVTATDGATNSTSTTETFTIQPDVDVPTATVALTGLESAGTYVGDVTATVTAADTGGSGVASTSFSLDDGPPVAYTDPIVIATDGSHTLTITVLDGAGNIGTTTSTLTLTRDVTAPDVTVTPSGTATAIPDTFAGNVTVTVASSDTGGSGLASTTIAVDSGAAEPYTTPITVTGPGLHEVHVVAIDGNGNTTTTSATFTIASGTATVTSPDDSVAIAGRLHFSNPVNTVKPARLLTVTNTGAGVLDVTGIGISGPQASTFVLAAGQPTTFTLNPGASTTIGVQFVPLTANVGENYATLTLTTDSPGAAPTIALAGLAPEAYYGTNEPSLQAVFNVLGFSGVNAGGTNLGSSRLPKGDEVIAPYMVAANPALPVTFLPLARYLSSTNCQCSRSGWAPKGSSVKNQLFTVNDNGAVGTNFNQTLLPTITGTSQFTTAGAFGLYTENGWWLDDGRQTPVTRMLRVYPAKTADGTVIPDTYLAGLDYGTGVAGKNFDFQDIVFLVKNARPELTPATARPNGVNLEFANSPAGSVLSSNGIGTGFHTVQANNAGTQYDASKLVVNNADGGTLNITSTAGTQVGRNTGGTNTQVNALEYIFDATKYNHSFTTQLRTPYNLTNNGQFAGMYYGPGQDDYFRVGIRRISGQTQLVAFYEVAGVGPLAESFQSVAIANTPVNLNTATTIQVRITASTTLGTLQASYQLNGTGGFINLGSTVKPKDISRWFSVQARAGLVTTNSGTAVSFTTTYDSFKGAFA